jgi:hypothetical protein
MTKADDSLFGVVADLGRTARAAGRRRSSSRRPSIEKASFAALANEGRTWTPLVPKALVNPFSG